MGIHYIALLANNWSKSFSAIIIARRHERVNLVLESRTSEILHFVLESSHLWTPHFQNTATSVTLNSRPESTYCTVLYSITLTSLLESRTSVTLNSRPEPTYSTV